MPTATAIRPARRTENIRYAVRDVLALAEEAQAAGRELLNLNVGDPNIFDFAPSERLVNATIDAIRGNRNGYAPSSGIAPAIEAITEEAERGGIENIQHVYVTSGASEAIDLALSALADAGDNVLVPSPGYPLYTAVLAKLEVDARGYDLDESANWEPDIEAIRGLIDERTRAIVLINPNNPTGCQCSNETLDALLELCVAHNIVLFSDEIYDKLTFDGRTHTCSASRRPDAKVITFNGLSKSYVVPGFRIGWGIISGPADDLREYCEAIQKMERARLSANHPEQYAIPAVLGQCDDHIASVVEKMQIRRDITVDRLNAIDGITCIAPQGAFYAFPRIELGISDEQFCSEVIRETGVVIVPGSGFGQVEGTQHFRVVFLPPEDVLHRAYDAIAMIAGRYS
ncbi:MAG: pyridoxal phosphate-dependent aminotransferase [Phycisphaerales bacterium]